MYELHCRLESLSSNKQADLSCTVYAPLVCKRSVSDQKLYTQGNKSLNATSVEIDWKVQIFENDLDSVSQNQEMVSGSLEESLHAIVNCSGSGCCWFIPPPAVSECVDCKVHERNLSSHK